MASRTENGTASSSAAKEKDDVSNVVAPAACEPEPKRKRLGRAARRRKQKLVDIQRAEDEIRGNAALKTVEEKPSVIPVDRGRVWPAVLGHRTLQKWSAKDETLLVAQLGYLPGNAIRISARTGAVKALCEEVKDDTQPVALQLYPIAMRDEFAGGKSDGRKFKSRKRKQISSATDTDTNTNNTDDQSSLIEPFPTMFWLTHPLLRVWVSKLELDGLGSRLEKRLAADPAALARMKKAHEAYGQERYRLLTESDTELIVSRGWEQAFAPTRGVAGIRNHAAVKCLHAHTAHYLSEPTDSPNNVIGEWVMEAVVEMTRKKTSNLGTGS